jgi:hypothetical protein
MVHVYTQLDGVRTVQVMVEQIQEKHAAVAKTDASFDEHHWRHEEMAVEAVVREALGDRASLCRVVRRPLPRPQHTADHHNPIAVGAPARALSPVALCWWLGAWSAWSAAESCGALERR